MTAKQIIASLTVLAIAGLAVLATSGSAFAVTPYPFETPFVSTKTRAEVQAEVVQAQKADLLNEARNAYPAVAASGNAVSRAEVAIRVTKTDPAVDGSPLCWR